MKVKQFNGDGQRLNNRTVSEFMKELEERYIGEFDTRETRLRLDQEIKDFIKMREHRGDMQNGVYELECRLFREGCYLKGEWEYIYKLLEVGTK